MSQRLSLFGWSALGALLLLPVACGDDDDGGGTGGTAGAAGSAGRAGSGGKGGTGGTGGTAGKDAGGDVRTDVTADVSGDTGGKGGTAGAAGAAGSGGAAGSSGKGGNAGSGGSAGGAPDGGPDADANPGDVIEEIPPPPEGGPDGDGGAACPAPTNPARARACVVFTRDQISFPDAGGPQLDGHGTFFIHVFGTPTPDENTVPLKTIVYPPPNADGGLNETSIDALPRIELDDLPTDADGSPGAVYIRTLFVDNPLWLQSRRLTYGMFVGGYNLNSGVRPPPPLRSVALTTGSGTVVPTRLTALRRFTTQVVLGLPDGGALAGNGQGPMSLGAFNTASPAGQPAFGGFQTLCSDVTQGAIPVAGFFYSLNGDTDFWIGAQVDDFGFGGESPGGAIVSLTSLGEIPGNQKITITADQYSATIPQVTLTGVRPLGPDAGADNVSCSAGEAGADAAVDVTSDANDAGNDASTDTANDGG